MRGAVDWSDPRRIPRGFGARPVGVPSPEYIQTNLFTLCQIGGLYDGIALAVEEGNREALDAWRLVSKAPTVLEYIRSRDQRSETHQGEQDAQSRNPHPHHD